MFRAVKLVKKNDPDKYIYSGYGIGFDSHSQLSWSDASWGKNLIIFEVDNSSSVHFDNKRKISMFLAKVQRKA